MINDRAFMGLTALIDALWERWVEDDGRLERSHLLIRLGTLEAATLGTGVQRMELATADQGALAALIAADLVRSASVSRTIFSAIGHGCGCWSARDR